MKYRLLSKTERELYGVDAMAIVDFNDVAALGASTTGNLSVFPATTSGLMPANGTSGTDTIPTNFAVKFEYLVVDTAFVSGSAAGLAVTIGDSGSATRFMASSQLQSGQTPVAGVVGITNRYYIATAETINAYFTSTTANLSTFTAGSMRVFFSLKDLGRLPTG
jgi:hypothetical protein